MLVLVALAVAGSADADEGAERLGLPVALVDALCAELEAAGQLMTAGRPLSRPSTNGPSIWRKRT